MTLPLTRLTVALGVLAACAVLAAAEPLAVDDLSTPPAASQEKIQEVVDAVELFRKQDVNGALAKLREAAQKYSKLPPAQVMLAQMYAQANQALGVRAALERAVMEDPQDPEAYVIIAGLDLQAGLVTEANLLFTKADELLKTFAKSPERKEALAPRVANGLSRVAEARRDWPTVQKHLEDLLKLAPKNAAAMQRLGAALFRQNKTAEALAQFKAAKEADPDNVLTPGATMATLYEEAGDHGKAAEWMKYALSQAPGDLRTRLVAGQWCLQTGQLDDAKQHAAKAIQIDPKSLPAKILRGVIALFQKDYKAAELYFETAHIASPGNFPASNNLALALCEQNDDDKKRKALDYARNNARQYEQGSYAAEAASTYGWVLYNLGRLAEADRALRQAIAGGNRTPDTLYYYAQVAADLNRADDAKNVLESVLKTTRPFSKRDEAQSLWDQLNK
jgi:tetratricopeptide (TPR) repeat protein